jgi:hypothetical protein
MASGTSSKGSNDTTVELITLIAMISLFLLLDALLLQMTFVWPLL